MAANYGDPTTRERLFLVATRGQHKPAWPDASHSKKGDRDLFGKRLKKWRTAKEIIEWGDKGISIFNREAHGRKPLSANTMRRIFAGLEKFCGLSFVLPPLGYHRANAARSMDAPLQTVTSRGGGHVIQPFLIVLNGTDEEQIRRSNRSVDDPTPSLVTAAHIAVVEPFVLHQQSAGAARSTNEPLPTISAAGAIGLIQVPFIISHKHVNGESERVHDADKPLPTLTSKPDMGIVQPFIVPNFGERETQNPRTHSVDGPLPTVTSRGAGNLVQPFLVEYYGSGGPESVDDPLNTVTTKDRHAIVMPEWVRELRPGHKLLYIPGLGLMDIRHRMLRISECARAHSCPDDYQFAGNKSDQMKMIGNMWPIEMGKAVIGAQLDAMFKTRKKGKRS